MAPPALLLVKMEDRISKTFQNIVIVKQLDMYDEGMYLNSNMKKRIQGCYYVVAECLFIHIVRFAPTPKKPDLSHGP